MKKYFVMAVAAIMAAMSVNAQEQEYSKHEVAVSYGAASNSTWMSIGDAVGTAIVSLGSIRYEDGSFFGPLGLEYFYHTNPVVGLGAIAVFARETQDMFIGNDPWGKATSTYVTVMPAAKFNWLHKDYFGMYSKVAAGLTLRTQKEDYSDGKYEDLSDSKAFFNFQLTAVGIEAGPEAVRGFVELGIGEQGVALAGLRCRF